MPLFRSKRERRLWILIIVALLIMYATMGLVLPMVEKLTEWGVTTVGFMFCMALIAVAVLIHAIVTKPGWAEIGVWLGIVAVYFLVFIRMTLPAERSHLIEYSVIALLIYEAFRERNRHGGKVPVPALLAILVATLFGLLDEGLQYFHPKRFFDPIDILFNFLAAVMAVGSSWLLNLVRKKIKA